jgi:hypothetical protein
MRASWPQVSGHISTAEGAKVFALGGKWNEYLDAQRCDEEGNPLPDAETLHLWQVHLCLVLAADCAAGIFPAQQKDMSAASLRYTP